MSLFVCVLHNLFEIVRLYGVQNVEEVVPSRRLFVRIFVLEVDIECLVPLQVRPKSFCTELLITRNMNVADLIFLHELLFTNQHLPHEVLVNLFLWWQVHLDYRDIR